MYSFRRSIRDSAALSFSVLNVRRLTVALSASLVSFLATVILLSSFFATNDDSYIQMALAGSLSGDYSAFVTFVGFSLTWSVSRLFACIPGVPWWGIVHFVSLFASVVFFILSLLSLSFSRRFRERGVFSFFVLFLFRGFNLLKLGLLLRLLARCFLLLISSDINGAIGLTMR